MTKRGLLLWLLMVALSLSAVPSWAVPAGKPAGPAAGSISALLPVAKITRGSGKQAVTTDAKKGDPLVWNDLIKTEKGGRARITLADQSILSLGSQAELRIVKHDARSQQTTLQMAYGRVRAQVASITRDGGSFELRTPTAVAGVIGTDFGVDSSSVGGDTFVCIAGAVQVANSDQTVAGSVQCTAGQTTTVQPGKPPSPPQPASPQQIQQLISDTEPAIIASLSPAGSLPGSTFDATIAGQNMVGINTVAISGTGVTVSLKGAAPTAVQIHVVIDANAAPGPRTITLAKATGNPSAAVFSVLGTPTGDLKTGYLQTLQELTQAGILGLNGFLSGAQQSADQIAQSVTNANLNLKKPIDLTAFANALNQQYSTLQGAVQAQNTAVQTASQTAATEFQTGFDAAHAALLQRDAKGTPDNTYLTAVAAAFQQANNTLQGAIGNAQTTLNGEVQQFAGSLNQLQTDWFTTINAANVGEQGPTPKVNALERVVNAGDLASFDASGSSGTQGASVASTTWVLCAASYQPAGFGTPLDPATPACPAMAGFGSTQGNFDVQTCNLNPGAYFARLSITDTNGKVTLMDVKITVQQPNYGNPSETLRGVADAYSSLQLNPFMSYFDPSAPGNGQLFVNMQKTLPTLSSMSINIVSSQDTVTCNEAVTRAAWQQKYTFSGSPLVITNDEQLSVYMHRFPGTGWKITTMVGDNGTVQGQIAGPVVTDAAQPDLIVNTVTLDSSNLTGTPHNVAPGIHTVQVTIANQGKADFTAQNIPVTVQVLDASQTVISSASVPAIPVPIASLGVASGISGTLTIPKFDEGTLLFLVVHADPGCGSVAQESSCSNNVQTFPLVVHNNIITFANVTPSLSISPGGPSGNVNMDVTSTFYPVTVCSSVLGNIVISAEHPGTKPSGGPGPNPVCKTLDSAGTLTFTFQAILGAPAGLQTDTFTATNNGDPTQGIPPASATLDVPITIAVADYVITDAVFAGHTAPYTGANALQVGETTQVLVTVKNIGNASPAGNITIAATCNDPNNCNPTVASAAAPAAGASVVVSAPINDVKLPVASYIGTASVTTDVVGAQLGPDFTLNFDVVDFDVTSPNAFLPSQNMPIGAFGILSVDVAVHVPQGNPFGIPVTPVANPNLTFTPSTLTTFGANIQFSTAVGTGTIPTPDPKNPDSITISAANHGVTKSITIPVNYFTAQLTPQSFFVNDAGNPLLVPVATANGAPNNYPDLFFNFTSNFDGTSAQLSLKTLGCGSFTGSPNPSAVAQSTNGIELKFYGSAGNTCPAASQLVFQVAIPNTNPSNPIPVYTLYVSPKTMPQLQVVSAIPPRDLGSQPWLAGEPLDWTVTVKNNGSGASLGNEVVVLSLNGYEVGRANLSSIAVNASGQVTVHTSAPDVPEGAAFGPNATLTAHLILTSEGDLAPGTGDMTPTQVNVSNWGIGINGAGTGDGPNALVLTVGSTPSASTSIFIKPLSNGAFNPNLALPVVLGAFSSGQLDPANISPGSVTSSAGSTITVNVKNGTSPLPDAYFVQVIAQMKDGSIVTTQRQATIHVSILNGSSSIPASINLASDRNNIAPCPQGQCQTPNSVVQINGPLPESVNLTATVSNCSPGPCVGTVDVSFTDNFDATATSPQIASIGVTSPGNSLPIRVKAATLPDGSVTATSASVIASVSAIQVPNGSAAHQPTPGPVGNNQFIMAYNIGDLMVNSSPCVPIPPVGPQTGSGPAPVNLSLSWTVVNGFNAPSVSWEWEDPNHIPVGASPVSFNGATSGTAQYSSGTYSALPTFVISNVGTGIDGAQTYFFAVTVSNGTSTATKYFPFTFDLSQSQTFCPATPPPPPGNSSHGYGAAQIIHGSWTKAGAVGAAHGAMGRITRMPDVRINPTDISFTPSMPKDGDTVSVRFRISNAGDANAVGVPVALQVNGETVVSDVFDVAAGKTTLAALQWANAKLAAHTPLSTTLSRPTRGAPTVTPAAAPIATTLNAALVVDPRHTMQQKTALAKSAPIAHLTLHNAAAVTLAVATLNQQRVVLELGEGACAGLRFLTGAGSCNAGDVSVTVEDLAKGLYKLDAPNGIADLGISAGQFQSPNGRTSYSMQAIGQSGHAYAVQLRGGAVGLFTLTAVRNPDQLSEAAKRVFRGQAQKAIRTLATSSAAPEPQKVDDSKVYFDIMYQGQ